MGAHTKKLSDLYEQFHSGINGLADEEVTRAREKHGRNEIPEADKISVLRLIFKQFNNFLVLVLITAAAVSFFADHTVDGVVILAIVIINAAIGFIQEYRADQAIKSLSKMMVPEAKVMRNGETVKIPAPEIVPGDIVILEEGDSIPADGVLIEASNLRCIESSLTGESVPVSKKPGVLPDETPLGDRENMVLKSTYVAAGSAKYIATGTGLNTAIGQIAHSLTGIKREPTNFQKKTRILGRQMAALAGILAGALFITAYFIRGYALHDVFMVSIAALVSAIPEGLPAILTIVLAIGAKRMAVNKAIIREFSATETLGAVTTIISDKTGTITQNVMFVKRIFVPGRGEFSVSGTGYEPNGDITQGENQSVSLQSEPGLRRLLNIAAHSNNAQIKFKVGEAPQIIGDPTEAALKVSAQKAGIHAGDSDYKKEADLPFSSDIKMRATLTSQAIHGRNLMIVGAPEEVLRRSNRVSENGEEKLLDDAGREALTEKIGDWSHEAMRVIGLAYKKHDGNSIEKDDLNDLVFAGFTGMIDPPREEAKKAIADCKSAGIRVIMATGDHVKTAEAVGKMTGIVTEDGTGYPAAADETYLNTLSDKEFENIVLHTNVFARLTPNMKLRIADVLQKHGELIAMTGDGVNDAPALKKADVGVSMGITGTDVARDSSQMVLADDNFATIVKAVEEGRIVFKNARQASFFLITTNFAEVLTIIIAVAMGLPMPLTAIQILWLNLITDGAGGLSLATEQGHGDELKQKPVKRKENIINKDVIPFLLINASVMAVFAIAAFKYYLPDTADVTDKDRELARTAVFIVLAFTQLYNVLNMRDLKRSVFSIGLFSNKYINLALIASALLQVAVIEIPFLKEVFGLRRMDPVDFLVLVLLSGLVLAGGELYKLVRKRFAAAGN